MEFEYLGKLDWFIPLRKVDNLSRPFNLKYNAQT